VQKSAQQTSRTRDELAKLADISPASRARGREVCYNRQIMAKRYCSQRKFWGSEACRECSNAPWPKCKNILKSKFSRFEKALLAWSLSRSRKEDIELHEKLMVTITNKIHECHWDRIFIIRGKLSEKFPDTKKDRAEMERLFNSLPEYIPMPGQDEVFVSFLRRR